MAINRFQGHSLAKTGVYLTTSVFSHGQLYVATSRVGDPNNIRFAISQTEFEQSRERAESVRTLNIKYTRNVVYKVTTVHPR